MATYLFTSTTTQEPAAVLAFFADMTNARTWDPSIRDVVRLDDGVVTIGSSFRLVIGMGARTRSITYRVSALEPERRLVLRARGSWYVSQDTILLGVTPEGLTSVRYEAQLRGRGVTRALDPLFQRVISQLGEAATTQLEAYLS